MNIKIRYVLLISFIFLSGCTNSRVVLDCWEYECKNTTITSRLINCNEWYIHLPVEDLKCDWTSKDIERVNYMSDPGNYIQAPITELKYDIKTLRTDESFNGEVKFLPIGQKIGTQSTDMYYMWDIAFLPDGTFLLTQKNGKMFHYRNNKLEQIGKIESYDMKLTGLLGLAVDPKFIDNKYIYVYYAYDLMDTFLGEEDVYVKHRVSRFKFNNNKIENEKILIDPILGAGHSGGRINFGPDGKLYIGTGDADNDVLAMDFNYLSGKILRINTDGSIPKDNPLENSPIFSLGHRNVQGLSWDPVTNILFSSEHGLNRHDEINRIEKGNNYGWGIKRCDEFYNSNPENKLLVDPAFCFKSWTGAPSGMTFVNDKNSPWYGNLFVGLLRGKHLHRFILDNGTIVKDEIFFINIYPNDLSNLDRGFRDVEYFNGSLYVLSAKGLAKLTPI